MNKLFFTGFLLFAILLKLTAWQLDFLKERVDKLEAKIEKLETQQNGERL